MTNNNPPAAFGYVDAFGRQRWISVEPDASPDDREEAAAEARAKGRSEALKAAIRAMYEAGERHEAAVIVRSTFGDDLKEVQ